MNSSRIMKQAEELAQAISEERSASHDRLKAIISRAEKARGVLDTDRDAYKASVMAIAGDHCTRIDELYRDLDRMFEEFAGEVSPMLSAMNGAPVPEPSDDKVKKLTKAKPKPEQAKAA